MSGCGWGWAGEVGDGVGIGLRLETAASGGPTTLDRHEPLLSRPTALPHMICRPPRHQRRPPKPSPRLPCLPCPRLCLCHAATRRSAATRTLSPSPSRWGPPPAAAGLLLLLLGRWAVAAGPLLLLLGCCCWAAAAAAGLLLGCCWAAAGLLLLLGCWAAHKHLSVTLSATGLLPLLHPAPWPPCFNAQT